MDLASKLAVLIGISFMVLSPVSGLSQNNDSTQKLPVVRSMEMSRSFDAPLPRVWKAWSEAALIKKWWGPQGFSCSVANIDFREGGTSLLCMRSADGFEIYTSWSYTSILPMTRIEFIQHFTDKDGKKISPSSIGMPPGIPDSIPHTITFKANGVGKTSIQITETGYTSEQIVEISKAGMVQVLDKMELVLKEKNN